MIVEIEIITTPPFLNPARGEMIIELKLSQQPILNPARGEMIIEIEIITTTPFFKPRKGWHYCSLCTIPVIMSSLPGFGRYFACCFL